MPTPITTPTPTYVQDNQQFKTVQPDGSLGVVTDNNVLQGLYGGSQKYQTVDQYNASKLTTQPAAKTTTPAVPSKPATPAVPAANTGTPPANPTANNNGQGGHFADGSGFDGQGNNVPAPVTTPGAGTGTGTTGTTDGSTPTTGTSNEDIYALLKKMASPDLPKTLTSDSPEMADYKTKTTANAQSSEDADNMQYEQQKQAEITQANQKAANLTGQARNKMAQLGVLDNSTYSVQYLNDLQTKLDDNIKAINTKYDVLKQKLDAKTKQSIIDAINKEVAARNKDIENQITNLNKSATEATSLFKSMSANELSAEKLKNTQAYNQQRIDLQTFQANQKAINDEISNRAKGIVKGAKGAMYNTNPDGSLTPVTVKNKSGQVVANGTSTPTTPKAGKTVTKGEVNKYGLPSTTPQADFQAVQDGINSTIQQSGGVTDANRYVLWGKVSDAITKAGGNAADYNAILWEKFHPEGLTGYKKYVGGTPAKPKK